MGARLTALVIPILIIKIIGMICGDFKCAVETAHGWAFPSWGDGGKRQTLKRSRARFHASIRSLSDCVTRRLTLALGTPAVDLLVRQDLLRVILYK